MHRRSNGTLHEALALIARAGVSRISRAIRDTRGRLRPVKQCSIQLRTPGRRHIDAIRLINTVHVTAGAHRSVFIASLASLLLIFRFHRIN